MIIILLILAGFIILHLYKKKKRNNFIDDFYYQPLDKRKKKTKEVEERGYYVGQSCVVERKVYEKLKNPNYDRMSGVEFEIYCMDLLSALGYTNIQQTSTTGDYGIDILANKRGGKYGFQCKRYSHPVGIDAVQEVVSGAVFYDCNKPVVITNKSFTKAAQRLARSNNVELWDGDVINRLINSIKLKEIKKNTSQTTQQKLIKRLTTTLDNRIRELQK